VRAMCNLGWEELMTLYGLSDRSEWMLPCTAVVHYRVVNLCDFSDYRGGRDYQLHVLFRQHSFPRSIFESTPLYSTCRFIHIGYSFPRHFVQTLKTNFAPSWICMQISEEPGWGWLPARSQLIDKIGTNFNGYSHVFEVKPSNEISRNVV